MKGWMVALAAASVLSLVPAKAEAGFCGVARYSCCAPCCQMQCHTVMKTVRCIEYEQQECHLLQNVLGPGMRRPGDQLRQVRPRDPHDAKFATRSASRSGKPRPAATRSASRSGKPRPARSATRSASRSGKPSTRCYTVCKPVLGKPQQGDLLHGLQAGLGNQDPLLHGLQAGLGNQDPHATRCASRCGKPARSEICYTVCKPVWEDQDPLLHGLQAGLGNQDPRDLLQRSRCR